MYVSLFGLSLFVFPLDDSSHRLDLHELRVFVSNLKMMFSSMIWDKLERASWASMDEEHLTVSTESHMINLSGKRAPRLAEAAFVVWV